MPKLSSRLFPNSEFVPARSLGSSQPARSLGLDVVH